LLTVLVHAFDLLGRLADSQVADLEQLRLGRLADRAVVGVFTSPYFSTACW